MSSLEKQRRIIIPVPQGYPNDYGVDNEQYVEHSELSTLGATSTTATIIESQRLHNERLHYSSLHPNTFPGVTVQETLDFYI